MKITSYRFISCSQSRTINPLFAAGLLPLFLALFALQSSEAGSATWNLNPVDSDWQNAANWTPNTIPAGPADTATFGVSNTTSVSVGYSIESGVGNIVFASGASAFTISDNAEGNIAGDWAIGGTGITNNSGITQNFSASADPNSQGYTTVRFQNSATAGTSTAFTFRNGAILNFEDSSSAGYGSFTLTTSGQANIFGGEANFYGNSTADHATFLVVGAIGAGYKSDLAFWFNSTAGNSIITNGGAGGATYFYGSATAGDATLIALEGFVTGFGDVEGGGEISFAESATAGNATLIANGGSSLEGYGGTISFDGDSTGGTARVELLDDGVPAYRGTLLVSDHNPPGITIGSLEGGGPVFLGANELSIGSNDLRTTFSGIITDDGTGGSLTKVGKSTLTLAGASTYTGTTTIRRGTLLVGNASGSGTGTGQVQVLAGTLGGGGTIAGPVIVGTSGGVGAHLSPGLTPGAPGTLTIQNKLFINPSATYNCGVKSGNATADKVIAQGVRINSGAQLSLVAIGTGTITPGTVFTAIDNTATGPILGTFANLANGSTITAGNNTYRANYRGGNGNDLTLTVVP